MTRRIARRTRPHKAWGAFVATGLLAAGCGSNNGAVAPAAFGTPLVTQKCDRTYRNDGFGFGLTPSDGSKGPDAGGASNDSNTLFAATWTSPSGRVYKVTIFNVGIDSFQDAVGSARGYNIVRGLTILDDRPIALDSGRVGWLMQTGSRGGATTMSVYDMRRGYFFALDVDVSGATTAELDMVNHVIQSFCVDP